MAKRITVNEKVDALTDQISALTDLIENLQTSKPRKGRKSSPERELARQNAGTGTNFMVFPGYLKGAETTDFIQVAWLNDDGESASPSQDILDEAKLAGRRFYGAGTQGPYTFPNRLVFKAENLPARYHDAPMTPLEKFRV